MNSGRLANSVSIAGANNDCLLRYSYSATEISSRCVPPLEGKLSFSPGRFDRCNTPMSQARVSRHRNHENRMHSIRGDESRIPPPAPKIETTLDVLSSSLSFQEPHRRHRSSQFRARFLGSRLGDRQSSRSFRAEEGPRWIGECFGERSPWRRDDGCVAARLECREA
jgi:hypothetical protein